MTNEHDVRGRRRSGYFFISSAKNICVALQFRHYRQYALRGQRDERSNLATDEHATLPRLAGVESLTVYDDFSTRNCRRRMNAIYLSRSVHMISKFMIR